MTEERLAQLEGIARQLRILTIEELGHFGTGHIGGTMSLAELLALLYFEHMKVNPADPADPDRDLLVVSKGHAGPIVYAALALKGYFPVDWLMTLNQGGTRLPSHCDRMKTPGIDMTAGSLGQGLSAAVGMALGLAMDGSPRRVWAVVGDGECNEGQIWEAAMFAGHKKLDRLIAFLDFNKQQLDGLTSEIMDIEPIRAKWEAFGWSVQRVDGHDLAALDEAIRSALATKGRPSMVIMDTIKGKGCSFAEGIVPNHHMAFDEAKTRSALEALGASTTGGKA